MVHVSAPEDLTLHGVRVLGYTSSARVAGRYRLTTAVVDDLLLDFAAAGLVRRTSFAGDSGWSLTELGRGENERRMAAELRRCGAGALVSAVHEQFLPLNHAFGQACTDWQVRPTRWDPLAANEHDDWHWDERVLDRLVAAGRSFAGLCEQLTGALARFGPYPELYASALARVESGRGAWIDAPDRDSLHLVWIQFHEDLIATLGIPRGSDG